MRIQALKERVIVDTDIARWSAEFLASRIRRFGKSKSS